MSQCKTPTKNFSLVYHGSLFFLKTILYFTECFLKYNTDKLRRTRIPVYRVITHIFDDDDEIWFDFFNKKKSSFCNINTSTKIDERTGTNNDNSQKKNILCHHGRFYISFVIAMVFSQDTKICYFNIVCAKNNKILSSRMILVSTTTCTLCYCLKARVKVFNLLFRNYRISFFFFPEQRWSIYIYVIQWCMRMNERQ